MLGLLGLTAPFAQQRALLHFVHVLLVRGEHARPLIAKRLQLVARGVTVDLGGPLRLEWTDTLESLLGRAGHARTL